MENYKNYCSYFIDRKALFGGFPNKENLKELINIGVKYFVDLTEPGEVLTEYYKGKFYYINYPIEDRKFPYDNLTFTPFVFSVYSVIKKLKNNEKIYIHCKGGHGRCGILVTILLVILLNINTYKALELTNEFHNNRKIMRKKWREIGSPQTKGQKSYVHRFFNKLYFYRAYKKGLTVGFSNYSLHKIEIKKRTKFLPKGIFSSTESLYQASKNADNKEYVKKQIKTIYPNISKKLGFKINISDKWLECRKNILKQIISIKLEQHEEIQNNLINSCNRKIIFNSYTDNFLGYTNGTGKNILGEILMELRKKLIEKNKPKFIYRG